MLKVKLKDKFAKMKKIKKLTPDCYDLYLDGYLARGKTVSAEVLQESLITGCQNGKDNYDKAQTATSKVKDKTEQRFVMPSTHRIVKEFTIENKNGAFSINEDSFFINSEYLPDDDSAPERIFQIVNAYCTGVNEYFSDKIKASDTMPVPETEYRGRWTVEFDNPNLLFVNLDGTLEPVKETSLNKDHVIETLFVYDVDYNTQNAKNAYAIMQRTITINGGKLKGLRIGTKENRIVPLNSEEFDGETQKTINEVVQYFQV